MTRSLSPLSIIGDIRALSIFIHPDLTEIYTDAYHKSRAETFPWAKQGRNEVGEDRPERIALVRKDSLWAACESGPWGGWRANCWKEK